jgi:hypothetical protein
MAIIIRPDAAARTYINGATVGSDTVAGQSACAQVSANASGIPSATLSIANAPRAKNVLFILVPILQRVHIVLNGYQHSAAVCFSIGSRCLT